jgi:hypothetical protein
MTPDLIYLVEIDAYDPVSAGVVTLRFASGLGMVTSPSETPPNTHFAPLLTQPINFTRTAFSDARVMGGSDLGYGEIRLNNADQSLSYMLDYGIDGRAIVVRVGLQGAAYPSGFTTLLTGTAEQLEAEDQEIIIRLRDRLAILDEPIQPQKYGGTNVLPDGVDGVADDIKDQEQPQGFGRLYHAPAVCENTARLIYGLHSRPDGSAGVIQAVDVVYDMAVPLVFGASRANLAALEANEPSPGYYDACLGIGKIRLGAAPVGRITADFRGEATGSYPNTVAGIVKRILLQAGVSSGDIDDASFTASTPPRPTRSACGPGRARRGCRPSSGCCCPAAHGSPRTALGSGRSASWSRRPAPLLWCSPTPRSRHSSAGPPTTPNAACRSTRRRCDTSSGRAPSGTATSPARSRRPAPAPNS